MSGRVVLKGTTNVSTVIRIIDSTDGTPETGVTSATAGLALEYRREGAASVGLTESDLSLLTDAHSDGGMLHIGNGYYRVDIPDAAFASGASGVLIHGTATGMVVVGTYHQLVDYDPEDAVRLGLTALPNANADAAGGLPISDAGGLDLDGLNTNVSAILTDTGTDGVVLANDSITAAKIAANAIGASELAADAVTEIQAGLATSAEISALNDLSAAAVNAEVDTALADIHLDHLIATADPGAVVANNSFLAKLVSASVTAAFADYDNTTDSLQAIRDVEPHGTAMRGTDSAALASVCTEARLAELDAANLPTDVDAILVDTGTTLPATLGTPAGADLAADIAAVKTDTAAILVDTGTSGVAIASGAITTASFGAGAIDAAALAADAANEIADALLDRASAIDGKTPRVAMQHIAASTAGIISGAGTGTETVKGLDKTTTRLTLTVDTSGNRSAITYNDA